MNLLVLGILLALIAVAYQFGLRKSRKLVGHQQNTTSLHSRPHYYGAFVALWCGVPAFLIFVIWNIVEPTLLKQVALNQVPAQVLAHLDPAGQMVLMDRIQAIASGFGLTDHPQTYELAAAHHYAEVAKIGAYAKFGVVVCIALIGFVITQKKIQTQYRARNYVEKMTQFGLALCSGVAILTTIGIVLSMLSEAVHFFHFVSPSAFFFGTEWNPGFSTSGTASGSYGLLPLLWGTFMVSAVALLVAIPVGLMTAIYLAEYASPRLRAWAKPAIEILAGIPTIVYGVFALMVVGPDRKSVV